MIQTIDKQLKTKRIMRSLETFVGGRPYDGDFCAAKGYKMDHSTLSMYYDYDAHVKGELLIELFNDFGFDCNEYSQKDKNKAKTRQNRVRHWKEREKLKPTEYASYLANPYLSRSSRIEGDYSKPSHEGYRNTIEVLDGNNVVPLRSDTIRLVQNECAFHGLRSEDPNQHLKDFLKLVDSFDLNGPISTWEDLTNRFLAQFFPPGRTSKLCNDILMFQQHQGESLSKAWTRFKYLLQKVPHHGIDLWLQIQIFYDHVNPITRRTIDQAAGGKLRDKTTKNLGHYWRASPSMTTKVGMAQETSLNRSRQSLCPKMSRGHPTVISSSSKINGPYDTQYCIENPEQAFVDYASSHTDETGVDMEREPTFPLLVGRGFLATTSAVIYCKKAKITIGEGLTRSIFEVKELAFGDETVPYWTTIGKRKSYKPRTSEDGIGAQPPYYAKRDFLNHYASGE
ncbi:zinc finger, CCHC-type containing protein [Tanacetum coccineum]